MTAFIVITFFALLFIILGGWLSIVLYSLKNGISPMPTSEKVKRRILSSIPQTMHGTIVDLGSGWGSLAYQIAKNFPHCHVVGYETSPIPLYYSKLFLYFYKIPNLTYEKKNFFDLSLKDVSLVYTYLYPGAMKELKKKFDSELSPGTIIISNTFAIPGWEAVQILEEKDIYKTRIYMYVKSSSNVDALHARSINEN